MHLQVLGSDGAPPGMVAEEEDGTFNGIDVNEDGKVTVDEVHPCTYPTSYARAQPPRG